MADLSGLIKAYDVRGIYPEEFDENLACQIGAAFAMELQLGPGDSVVVGRDMRPSGPSLVQAFVSGLTERGVDVIDIGMCSTDGLYFASGSLGLPGAMFTASHNPAEYNGIKMCRAHAVPVGDQTGLANIRDMVEQGVPALPGPLSAGHVTQRNMLGDYAAYLRSLVDISNIRPLRVVVDAGNGMAGLTTPAVLAPLPLTVTELYFELDGSFPNHEANPIDPENLRDLQAAVVESGADLGLAFDGDADRCFAVDERGELISPSAMTGLIAVQELAKYPGATVIHNLITSAAVPELIAEHGGVAVRTRVGHSFIKDTMARTGAIFGGEHSGHFYFRDFWRADSGMLAALHLIAALGNAAAGTTVSSLMQPYERYYSSGEINSVVADVGQAKDRVRAVFAEEAETVDELDGLTFIGPDWWFNVRPSNTEPLLRLNVEHRTSAKMAHLRDRVLQVIRSEGP